MKRRVQLSNDEKQPKKQAILVREMHYKPMAGPTLTVNVDCSCRSDSQNKVIKMAWAMVARNNRGQILYMMSGLSNFMRGETSNHAEFRAIIKGIYWGLKIKDKSSDFNKLAVITDSRWIYNEIKGLVVKPNEVYAGLMEEVRKYEGLYKLYWVYRDVNEVADRIAKFAVEKLEIVVEDGISNDPYITVETGDLDSDVNLLIAKEFSKENWKPFPNDFPKWEKLVLERYVRKEGGSCLKSRKS